MESPTAGLTAGETAKNTVTQENNKLVLGGFQSEPITISPAALAAKSDALAASALIGKVETGKENEASSRARQNIKSIARAFEKCRRELTDPALEYQRTVKRIVDKEIDELLREDGRLECLEKDFMRAELRRRAEEEELQRKELARIEAEKQAELLRIAREQAAREAEAARVAAEAERKAREEREAAERLARDATNKKQRAAAELARIEADKRAAEAKAEAGRLAAESQARAVAEAQAAAEHAAQASYIESKTPEISRAKGQTITKVWIIDQINDFQLMKSRPDLVRKVEWDLTGLKQALTDSEGKIAGVIAHQDINVGNRGGKTPAFIEA
jgi:membrane protein involved in colicin uptake